MYLTEMKYSLYTIALLLFSCYHTDGYYNVMGDKIEKEADSIKAVAIKMEAAGLIIQSSDKHWEAGNAYMKASIYFDSAATYPFRLPE